MPNYVATTTEQLQRAARVMQWQPSRNFDAGRARMEVVVPASSRRDDLDYRLGLAAAVELTQRPALARTLPRALVKEIAATPKP